MFTISLSPAMPAFLSRNCKVYIAHVAISTKCSHLFASTDAFLYYLIYIPTAKLENKLYLCNRKEEKLLKGLHL